jgi:hypothetical protein
MSSSVPSAPWSDFTADPRTPHAAPLRASDRDRDVVAGVLTEAYADGRLTREEYDERAGAATAAKTLGDLPPLIVDLVPQTSAPTVSGDLARATPDALHELAVQRWEAHRRRALRSFLVPTLICWVIWVATSFGGGFHPAFPWPLFVMLGTGVNLVRVLVHRQDLVLEEQRRLERRQRKALESPKRPGERGDAWPPDAE